MKKLFYFALAVLSWTAVQSQKAEDFIERANQGSAASQYNLGVCYEEGWGTEKDFALASVV